VAGRRFDLVVANPPFIVKPGTVEYLYRDSGMHLDSLGARLAAAAPGVLAEGGTMQYLASFVHPRGGDWAERVAAWVAGTGLDAWIVQLGETDPQGYVQTWSSGHDMSLKERAAWLAWLGEQDVASIGWGLVTLRASGRDDPCVRVENRPGHEPRGAEVRAWFTRHDWLRDHDPLAARYLAADGVALTQVARLAGPHGWEVGRHLVSNGAGAPVEVNQLVVDLIEGCDGTLTARDLVAKLAAAHGLDPAELTETAATAIPRLVEYGSLIPA
jgi:methylase of polypeptide subunit release factors